MRHALYTLCTLLLMALPVGGALAAETLDEKVYDPGQRPPATGTAPTPDARVTPERVGQAPDQTPGQSSGGGDTIIVVPSAPGQPPSQPVPDQSSTLPVPPDTQKEAPAIVVPTVPAVPTIPVIPVVPEIPKTPDTEKKDIIVTPVQPVTPEEKAPPKASPPKGEDKVLTPADFLPTTPEKKTPEKAEAKPKDDPKKVKPEKAPKDPQKDKAKPDPKTEKPDTKQDPQKNKPSPEKKKGEALRIPADAGKTGKMDFLEGCWKGRLSGRAGNDVIDNMGSRFCFDANGKGKHFLYDPKRKETCVGSANGGVKPDGTLHVDFDNLYCPSGETWYPQGDKYMTCRDGGNGADCKWYYKGNPRTTGPFYRD